jgi:hypothetical protein
VPENVRFAPADGKLGVLSFDFKTPMTAPGVYPEHDVFI